MSEFAVADIAEATVCGLLAHIACAPTAVIRGRIQEMEDFLLTQPQTDIPVTHTFAGDNYVRSIVIKKGVMATGATHRHSTIHLVLQGRMTVVTPAGGMREVQAPCIFVSPPGAKMAGYAHEDTIWATTHTTQLRDIAAIEAELCYSADEVELLYSANPDHRSFAGLIGDMGLSLAQVNAQVRTDDVVDMPEGDWPAFIAPSCIQGVGLFSRFALAAGSLIGPARTRGSRTPMGRYANHSASPNAEMRPVGDDLDLVAVRPIEPGEEITTDYRATLAARGVFPALQGELV